MTIKLIMCLKQMRLAAFGVMWFPVCLFEQSKLQMSNITLLIYYVIFGECVCECSCMTGLVLMEDTTDPSVLFRLAVIARHYGRDCVCERGLFTHKALCERR